MLERGIDAIFTARGCDDNAIVGYLFGKFGKVIAPGFCPVTTTDKEEATDLTGFDSGDDLISKAKHCSIMETGAKRTLRILR